MSRILWLLIIHCVLITTTHKAIGRGDISTIEQWLKDEGTKVNECKGGSDFPRHHAVANGTALHWAVYYGQLEIAQLLLNSGAGIMAYAIYVGMTSKKMAATLSAPMTCSKYGNVCVRLVILLDSNAEVSDRQVAKAGKSFIFWLLSSFAVSQASVTLHEAITMIQTQTA